MRKFLIVIFTLTILSCKNRAQNNNSTTSKSNDTIKVENSEDKKQSNSTNKVTVNFKQNEDLLNIILLLPDSAFSSWEWKLEERVRWYNEIKENNSYTDDNPDYFTQKYFSPNKAGFSIVDGFWSINIYKTLENSYIVITDDIVGDGHSLNFYEVKFEGIEKYLDEKIIFSDFKEMLKKKETDDNCEEKFEEMNDPIFEYDFSNKNKIEIESSWYLTKEDYDNCLIGNAIVYNFNPKNKRFEFEKVYWKPKKKQ